MYNAGADPEEEGGFQEDEGDDGIKRKRGGAKKWTSEKQRRRAMGDDLDKKKGWEQAPDDSGLVSFLFIFLFNFLKKNAGSICQMTLAWSL